MSNCHKTCSSPSLHREVIICMALKELERIKYQHYLVDTLRDDVQSNKIMEQILNG